MAQLGSRRGDQQRTQQANSGPKVWLETCTACGRPVTVLAPLKPDAPRCKDCGPAPEEPAAADPGDA